MMERVFVVKNKLGLHARPAALFVQSTNKFKATVKVHKGETEVDGKSIMGLMMLAAEEGAKIKVVSHGADEKDLLDALEQLFSDRFGEKD